MLFKRYKNNKKFLYKKLSQFFCLSFLFFSSLPVVESEELLSAGQMKTIYVFNFLKFLDWRETSLNKLNNYVICIMNSDDEYSIWEKLNNREINGKAIKIRKIYPPYRDLECHIFFMKNKIDDNSRFSESTVLISESEKFFNKKGMIYLFLEDNRLRFSIDHDKLKETHVIISSNLLRLAKVVKHNEVKE